MGTESLVIGGIFVVIVAFLLYGHFKPASGVRARNDKGHFVADDKSTENFNEAYVDGKTPKSHKPKRKAPAKKPAAKKPAAKKAPAKAPARRGRPRKTTAKK